MIVRMCRIRLLGPRDQLSHTLDLLQDFGRVQVDRVPFAEGMAPVPASDRTIREQRYLSRLFEDANAALLALGVTTSRFPDAPRYAYASSALKEWARSTRRARRSAEKLQAERQALTDEQAVLSRYADFLNAFSTALGGLRNAPHFRAYGVTLPASERPRVERLGDTLRNELGGEVIVSVQPLPGGDLAVLIAVPSIAHARMETALSSAQIAEVPLPEGYSGQSLTEAAPHILARIAEIPGAIRNLDEERQRFAESNGSELVAIRTLAQDQLAVLGAEHKAAATPHAFAVEGWMPEKDLAELRRFVADRMGSDVVLEVIAREDWSADTGEAPVVLSNPRIFRPFEVLTSLMPLPKYGSIDPTPFVAVGFPMIFGMMLGDVGYGVILAGVGLIFVLRNTVGTMWRTVGEIALACAAFAIIFGFLFGELFGSLGSQWFGLRPILFNRETSILSAMILAVSIGLVHTLLGVILGFLEALRSSRRVAASRATQLLMMALIVAALLSAVEVLPHALLTPLSFAALIGFPILLVIEGIVAPIEFLSTLSSVLSYLRIMALGTASVILASIANRMVGMFGSVLVGVLFALLFHLVNFALGVFSPTIHALRLHYVEFFRSFFTPGGQPYKPFKHQSLRGHS